MSSHVPTPPKLDDQIVQRLAALANKIDGSHESVAADLVDEFNSLAGTDIPYAEFQGIYGGEEHEDYVRRVLTAKATKADPTIGRDELTAMFKRVCDDPTDDG